MAFTNKNLQSSRNNMGFIKGATLFFLGMSCIFFMTRAFEILPSATNTIQVIQNILLTMDGNPTSDTGVYLQGDNGDGYFKGDITSNGLCLIGDDCISTWSEITAGLGGGGGSSVWSTGSSGKVYYSGGNVGIGTSTPQVPLEVGTVDSNGVNMRLARGNSWIRFMTSGGSEAYNSLTQFGDNGIFWGSTIDADTGYNGFVIAPHSVSGKGIRIDSGGNVGIGISSPTYELDVNGTGKFLGLCLSGDCRATWPTGGTTTGATGFLQGGVLGATPFYNGSIWITGDTNIFNTGGNVGIGTSTPGSYKFYVSGTSYFQNNITSAGVINANNGITSAGVINANSGLKLGNNNTDCSSDVHGTIRFRDACLGTGAYDNGSSLADVQIKGSVLEICVAGLPDLFNRNALSGGPETKYSAEPGSFAASRVVINIFSFRKDTSCTGSDILTGGISHP